MTGRKRSQSKDNRNKGVSKNSNNERVKGKTFPGAQARHFPLNASRNESNRVPPGRVLEILERELNTPISDDLKNLMDIRMDLTAGKNGPTFSSDETIGSMTVLASSLQRLLFFPTCLPDFGISLGGGSSVCCTLVDKERKILVNEEVNMIMTNRPSWKSFENSLRTALDKAKKLESEGRDFDFVFMNQGRQSVI